ncbi:MAG TPA: CvpA family protein [Candidatus Angelobacter sp.]|nr:CvpA family protein [Candidatus Angelobacter sp.]
MNGLDWAILGVMLVSVWLAAVHGFFFEIFSLAGTVIGFLLAAWGYWHIASWFLPYVKSPAIADLAGFLTIFFAVVLAAGIIARIVRKAIREVGLRWIDRFLGGAFGLVRGVVIVTVGVMAITAFAPESPQLAGSQLAGYFQLAGGGASWLAPSAMREKFHEGEAKLRHAASEHRK